MIDLDFYIPSLTLTFQHTCTSHNIFLLARHWNLPYYKKFLLHVYFVIWGFSNTSPTLVSEKRVCLHWRRQKPVWPIFLVYELKSGNWNLHVHVLATTKFLLAYGLNENSTNEALSLDNEEFNFIIIFSHIYSNIPEIYGKVRNH